MTYASELAPGTIALGHAIGHAAAMYGDSVGGYDEILRTALRGRHRAPATTRTVVSDFSVRRARELLAQSDEGANGILYNSVTAPWEWIGAATAILRELTRDA